MWHIVHFLLHVYIGHQDGRIATKLQVLLLLAC